MQEAFDLSLKLTYKDVAPNDDYLTPRDFNCYSKQDGDMIAAYADGLYHKYLHDRMTGHCSLNDTINFDIAKFEDKVIKDIVKMNELLLKVGKPIKLDFAEMQKRGYKGEWAGL